MWTRSSDRWAEKPGSFDTLNARRLYPSLDKYGIPLIKQPSIQELPEPPSCLIPYNLRVRSQLGYADSAMHFFIDDYRFELVWSKPNLTLSRVKQAWLVLTPDFSLYADYPLAAQIWNTYRNRWCGAYWQSEGRVVIPTIAWSTPESYEFCFNGVEYGSPVAISTQGLKVDEESYGRFKDGYREMVNRINPRFIMCYGKADEEIKSMFPDKQVICYPTYWESLRKARKQGKAKEFFAGEPDVHRTTIETRAF